ncbi:MAG: cellulase family glycosylhydrolase [Spirochaetales bacterium]|nr:cellulase family glycosylhydrolase [Spirochaetales bacterium]
MWYGFNVLWMFWSDGAEGSKNPDSVHISENDIDAMAEMGCNFVRLPTDYRFFLHNFEYDNPDEKMLKVLDRCIEAIVNRGLHCSLNVHRGPGYCINGNNLEKHNLWKDKIAQDAFVNLWKLFANRYKNYSKDQLSFDLLNEPPAEGQYGLTREIHKAIMARTAGEIRKITPDRIIICDGLGGGHLACPELADLNVVLSGRGYMPFRLTHWNADWVSGSDKWEYPKWPGMFCDNTTWNREALKNFYAPWKALKDSGCTVHIGEAGCFNKVSNDVALAWYKDFFSVCNELGFGFALWNFRGPFGIAEHGREGTNWIEKNGIKFDRDLYELFVNAMIF